MRTMAFALASLLACAQVASAEERQRDVYFSVCSVAWKQCKDDWGGGCIAAAEKTVRWIRRTDIFSKDGGGDGGGTDLPFCMVLSRPYSQSEAPPHGSATPYVRLKSGRYLGYGYRGDPGGGN